MSGVLLALALNFTANVTYSNLSSPPPWNVANLSDTANQSVVEPDIITTAPTVPQPPVYVFVTVTLIYTLLFVLGVAGNLLVFIVVWRHPDMRSSTNCFIVNLSVADTLVIIVCMPTSLIELYSKNVWHLGPVMCEYTSRQLCIVAVSYYVETAIQCVENPSATNMYRKQYSNIKKDPY